MSSKYIVRQPIKDQANKIIGYEIQYHGENQAFGDNGKNVRENDFAAADTIYNFLTMNTDKLLRGSLNFMTFTTTLLMKKTPHLFDKGELVIQIDDSVIIHPLAMHMVQQYAKEGYQVAVNEFQFAPRYLGILDRIDYIKLNIQTTPELTLKNIICRLRPCNVFTNFPMLIARPTSYSFPSGHTSSSFAAALILTLRHKKVGWLAYIPAVLIAFSRIFLFVHYPTDVLAGILLGTLAALLTYFAAKAIQKRQAEKRTAQI